MISINPQETNFPPEDLNLAISTRQEKLQQLKQQMRANPQSVNLLMPQIQDLLAEIGYYQKQQSLQK